jgi:hypothetical protein
LLLITQALLLKPISSQKPSQLITKRQFALKPGINVQETFYGCRRDAVTKMASSLDSVKSDFQKISD